MLRTEVAVVGAGIAGLMTALALARRGHSVTVIDRWEPGHARASSSDYNRVIRAIHGKDHFYTRWARESRLRWLELQQETGQQLYYECGALILATAGKCHWEDNTAQTFTELGVPFTRYSAADIAAFFPQFATRDISYALYEPEAGMVMAHRALITTVGLLRKLGTKFLRGHVTTDAQERLHLDGKPLQADLIVVATGPWMTDMFPRTIKPITQIVGINVLYTSTPDGSDLFDQSRMPCWIDHGQGSFGLPSVEGSGVKAAVVIPDTIDLDNDERLIRQRTLSRTRQYIARRLPGLNGEKVVDSKFNQIVMTPDTHFILDFHPEQPNVLLAGGCSGHLFKHGPVFGDFAAGVGLRDFGTPDRFRLGPRKKLPPSISPSGR
jgi:glycine/D-amino acid oxidase-like deaminating enzyme